MSPRHLKLHEFTQKHILPSQSSPTLPCQLLISSYPFSKWHIHPPNLPCHKPGGRRRPLLPHFQYPGYCQDPQSPSKIYFISISCRLLGGLPWRVELFHFLPRQLQPPSVWISILHIAGTENTIQIILPHA